MQKDKSKNDRIPIFSFTNSIKNSTHATPETSTFLMNDTSNVSFHNNFNTSMKSFQTEPYCTINDSAYPQLFHSNDKENMSMKKFNSNQWDQQKTKSKGNKTKLKTENSSKKKLSNLSVSKQKKRPVLAEKNINNLPNLQFDLASSYSTNGKSQSNLLSRTSSEKKLVSGLKRQENIKVFVRLRPKTTEKQKKDHEMINIMNEQTIKIDQNYFSFDKIFNQDANQGAIFESVGQAMCRSLFQGFNGTIFAYGQTGSGKTYTIFGEETAQHCGLIYRCIKEILQYKTQHGFVGAKIKCSMVELYKEQLIDMFGNSSDLRLKENKNGEIYIEGLRQIYIRNEKQMMNLVKEGAKSRKVTSTKLNEQSSRSHTILSIYLQQDKYTTKLCLIDLAGSEKVCKSGAQGQAFEQTKKINYSLSCLGNVINALTTRNKQDHVPFRDSKLTRLLKDSLTGNFLTSIIVNCSSQQHFVHQTISSLKFAQRAKKVKIDVLSLEEEIKGKETITQLHSIIKKLQFDLTTTTSELKKYKQKQKEVPKPKKERKSTPKKILINIPLSKVNKVHEKKEVAKPKVIEEEKTQIVQGDLTGRNPIPSQRALVYQNLKRYNEKVQVKPQIHHGNGLNINDFSSLNVSKSFRKFENSPDLSSLELKYDESPDISLSFSIQGESGRRQVALTTPK